MIIVNAKGSDVRPQKSDGTFPSDAENQAQLAPGVTLVAGSTYFYLLDAPRNSGTQGFHIKFDNAIALTVTLEHTNLVDVSAVSTTAGDWQEEDSTTDLTINKSVGTLTGTSLAITAGTAGSASFVWKFAAAIRTRLKIVVGGTGGVVRVAAVAKDL
jgi:hypothetical protein